MKLNASKPFRYCRRTNKVWGHNDKIGGETMVCDIRGWGYLTGRGHGALGLSREEASAIQQSTGETIARLLNEVKDAV